MSFGCWRNWFVDDTSPGCAEKPTYPDAAYAPNEVLGLDLPAALQRRVRRASATICAPLASSIDLGSRPSEGRHSRSKNANFCSKSSPRLCTAKCLVIVQLRRIDML